MPFTFSDDTQAAWSATARTPAVDELAWARNTRRFVVGDGATSWAGLTRAGWHAPTPTPEFVNVTTDSLRALRALLSTARQETAIAPVIAIGASIDMGFGGGGVQYAPASVALRALAGRGVPLAGTGWSLCENRGLGANDAGDTRWTHGFGGLPPAAQTPAGDVCWRSSTAAGQTETFTADVPGTTVQVAALATSGTFSVTIDGAAPPNPGSTITTTTGGLSVTTYTGLPSVAHKVVLTASTTTPVYLCAIRCYGGTGLELHQWGEGAADSRSIANTAPNGSQGSMLQALLSATPAVVIVGLCMALNDHIQFVGPSIATTTSGPQYGAVISQLQAAGHQVVLSLNPPIGPAYCPESWWNPWRDQCYNLAVAYGVPLLDMTGRWRDWYTNSAAGIGQVGDLYNGTDLVHPGVAGCEEYGGALGALLTLGTDIGGQHADPAPLLLPLIAAGNFGVGWAPACYQRHADGTVVLSGLIGPSPTAQPYGLATLPVGYRPGNIRMFNAFTSGGAARIDITQFGVVNYVSGPTSGGTFLSLDGIRFPAEQ